MAYNSRVLENVIKDASSVPCKAFEKRNFNAL
jgi:hypothetical protein